MESLKLTENLAIHSEKRKNRVAPFRQRLLRILKIENVKKEKKKVKVCESRVKSAKIGGKTDENEWKWVESGKINE